MTILLEALARKLGDTGQIEGFSARKLRHYYLLNPEESDESRYKLLLTATDKRTLLSIMDQKPIPKEHDQPLEDGYSLRILENFKFFSDQIDKSDLSTLCKGLAKLMLVDISLDSDQDNPQLIFESMNSTGRELSQADLIRNFILMRLDPRHQQKLYKEHWRPMEVAFGQEHYDKYFDKFMRHYLTIKTGEIPNVKKVYEAFKKHAYGLNKDGVDKLVADVHDYARYYCTMVFGAHSNPALHAAFCDIRELKVDVVYPLLLVLYHSCVEGKLSAEDFEHAVRLIESYVFRRRICEIPINSLSRTFSNFHKDINKEIGKEHYLESIRAHFLLLQSYRRFPRDEEFKRNLKERDLYNIKIGSYWLRKLEMHGRKEPISFNELTIEHIMPQNKDLSRAWRKDLGSDWEHVQESLLHTLGNLTLTGYNSEYGDRSFVEKRDMKGGFKQSPLRLNEGLGELESWNEDAIRKRADKLAEKAIEVWQVPCLAEATLYAYRKETAKSPVSSLEHYASLVKSPQIRRIFDALRVEILALNPCVYEELMQIIVAYKAETNFVDVQPQHHSLKLFLNLSFHELDDPRALARDVSGIGRQGKGEVEVKLQDLETLPYVMGLIRQALEKQLGEESE